MYWEYVSMKLHQLQIMKNTLILKRKSMESPKLRENNDIFWLKK